VPLDGREHLEGFAAVRIFERDKAVFSEPERAIESCAVVWTLQAEVLLKLLEETLAKLVGAAPEGDVEIIELGLGLKVG
jgi:hypothetical protein